MLFMTSVSIYFLSNDFKFNLIFTPDFFGVSDMEIPNAGCQNQVRAIFKTEFILESYKHTHETHYNTSV